MTGYPKPAVRVVIRNEDGNVLLVRKANAWDLPGNPFEGGKDWNAAVRSCLDAMGAGSATARLVGLYADKDPEPTVTAVFLAHGVPQRPTSETEWFSSEKLPSGLGKTARHGIADALAFRGDVFSR